MKNVTYPLRTDNGQGWPEYALIDGEIVKVERAKFAVRDSRGTLGLRVAIRRPGKRWLATAVVPSRLDYDLQSIGDDDKLDWRLVEMEGSYRMLGPSDLVGSEVVPVATLKEYREQVAT